MAEKKTKRPEPVKPFKVNVNDGSKPTVIKDGKAVAPVEEKKEEK